MRFSAWYHPITLHSGNNTSPERGKISVSPKRSLLAAVPVWLASIVAGIATPLVTAQTATQYTAQFLPPPTDQPALVGTDAYALNNVGQVLGRAITLTGTSRAPVLWTAGVGQTLPVPARYAWVDEPLMSFINDSGVAVSTVDDVVHPLPTGGFATYPIVWLNGAVVAVINAPPPPCVGGMFPIGLNKAGDVLVVSCGLFIWTQAGGFQSEIPEPAPIAGCNGLSNTYTLAGNHLNDADHTTFEQRYTANTGGCPITVVEQPVLYIPPSSVTPVPIPSSSANLSNQSLEINNLDQLLLVTNNALQLWDGTTLHDIPGAAGYASMNNLGQVAFMAGSASTGFTPSLYQNGVATAIALPPGTQGFSGGPAATALLSTMPGRSPEPFLEALL